ncbi:putative Zn-dependent protease domain protein [Rickettsia amblyommatis str. Darkwater]|uniref:Putative Zn-dependent protease n=1 Tax=Rickettsia amblyommatis (strain GAT-30V) TaxID=1105111 RepID=H8K657_RICAG|nr:putative Zn-dependent protease [Rickettsia amblyommatis str. GAT-30V]KJV98570.1 putative Zn-dependent protease domain protein [Rickettsia amblyommatis str. Darkwater]
MSDEERKTCFKKGINCLDQGKYGEALKIFGMLLIQEPRNIITKVIRYISLRDTKRY